MPLFYRPAAPLYSLLLIALTRTALSSAAGLDLEPILADSAGRIEREQFIFDGVQADPRVAASLPAYLQARGANLLDWLADGSILVSTRFGDHEQLHRVRVPAGAREQLTFESSAVISGATHPFDTNSMVFVQSVPGADARIVLARLDTHAQQTLVTDAAPDTAVVWAHDGKRIAYTSRRRNGSDTDVYTLDTSTIGALPRLVAGTFAVVRISTEGAQLTGATPLTSQWRVCDWSLDDRQLLLIREVSASESYLYVLNVASGELSALDAPDEVERAASDSRARRNKKRAAAEPLTWQIRAARFAPDGHGVVYLSDKGEEFMRLRYLDLDSKQSSTLTPQINHDVSLFQISADSRYLAYTYEQDGLSRLTVVDQQRKLELSPNNNAGLISAMKFDRSAKRLAMTAESSQSPRDVYVYDAESGTTTRWTQSEIGPLDAASLIAPSLLRFPTWDRDGAEPRQLPAFVYRPGTLPPAIAPVAAGAAIGAFGAAPHPVLVLLHDEPNGQYRPGFDLFIQYVVGQLGYVVIAPNLRGSAGYGRGFAALDNGARREDTLRDFASLLVWIGLQRDLDRDRVLVMGQGYGGYLALSALTQYGDRLRGGVDVAGISDFVTYLEKTAPQLRDARRAEYGDERDADTRGFLQRISPLNSAAALRRPVLIVHGLLDLAVPASESEQLLIRLRSAKRDAGYVAIRNAEDPLESKSDRDLTYSAIASFLARFAGAPNGS